MALATLADVKRVLHITDVDEARDADITSCLVALSDWVKQVLRAEYDATSTVRTVKYYDVHEDAALAVPVAESAVNAVRVYLLADAVASALTVNTNYEVKDGRTVRLRPPTTSTPFEGATAGRLFDTYARVEIDYTPPGTVPASVRDGVAMLAAGWWQSGPQLASGVTSERIGDYSFSTRRSVSSDGGADAVEDFWSAGMKLLHPWIRSSVAVT